MKFDVQLGTADDDESPINYVHVNFLNIVSICLDILEVGCMI